MTIWSKVAAILLVCSTLCAQEFNIVGPTGASVGEPVKFEVPGFTDVSWQFEPSSEDAGRVIYILNADGSVTFCTYPGKYTLFAGGIVEGKPVTDKHVFVVEGDPDNPVPDPVVPLSPVSKLVKDNLNVQAHQKDEYKKLASFFKNTGVTELSQLQSTTKTQTNSILTDTQDWTRLMKEHIAPKLFELKLESLEQHLQVWKEIGLGIEAAL